VVLFDSAAIIRYLDGNFPDTPRLFGGSHGEQWEIEDWEMFARSALAGPMMEVVHLRVSGGTVDDAMLARCSASFSEAVRRLASRLEGRDWLVGDRMSVADITAAAVMRRVRAAGLLTIPPEADALSAWESAVMEFDGKSRVPV
jgi:glutathione S-transferase